MAKNMARLNDNGYVINIEWCSDETQETVFLKEIDNFLISIGDTYKDGKFYREGNELLTPYQELLRNQEELFNSYENGVNSI